MENTQIQYQARYKNSHLILEHASMKTDPSIICMVIDHKQKDLQTRYC